MINERLGSVIGPFNNGGTKLTELSTFVLEDHRESKLVKYNNQAMMDSKQKNVKKAKIILNELCHDFGLHSVTTSQIRSNAIKEEAEYYYDQIFDKKIMKGLPIRFVVSVSLYIACLARNFQISMQKVIHILDNRYSIKTFNKYVNRVKTELTVFYQARMETPEKDISEAARNIILKIPESILSNSERKQVLEMIEKLKTKNYLYSSKSTGGYIGALIYGLFRKKNLSQAYLGKISEVDQTTISNTFKELKDLEVFAL